MKNKNSGLFFLFCFISCICILFASISCAPPSVSPPEPTANPTNDPTPKPVITPAITPVITPEPEITPGETDEPTPEPETTPGETDEPTDVPTAVPTAVPTVVPTAAPTAVPSAVPTAVPAKNPGDVWLIPGDKTVSHNEAFSTQIHVHSGIQVVAAYGIYIYYESSKLHLNTAISDDGIEVGQDGFLSAVKTGNDGELHLSGFDTNGAGPGEDLHLLTVNWIADDVESGMTILDVFVDILVDQDTEPVGNPDGIDGSVTINE